MHNTKEKKDGPSVEGVTNQPVDLKFFTIKSSSKIRDDYEYEDIALSNSGRERLDSFKFFTCRESEEYFPAFQDAGAEIADNIGYWKWVVYRTSSIEGNDNYHPVVVSDIYDDGYLGVELEELDAGMGSVLSLAEEYKKWKEENDPKIKAMEKELELAKEFYDEYSNLL